MEQGNNAKGSIGYRGYSIAFRAYSNCGDHFEDARQMAEKLKEALQGTVSDEDTEKLVQTIGDAIQSGWVGGLKEARQIAHGNNAHRTAQSIQSAIISVLPWKTHEWYADETVYLWKRSCENCGISCTSANFEEPCPGRTHHAP